MIRSCSAAACAATHAVVVAMSPRRMPSADAKSAPRASTSTAPPLPTPPSAGIAMAVIGSAAPLFHSTADAAASSHRARADANCAPTAGPYMAATVVCTSAPATQSTVGLFSGAPTGRVCRKPGTTGADAIRPHAPVAIDGSPAPAMRPAMRSADAARHPASASAAACSERTLASAATSRSACAARCSAKASAGSASSGRPAAATASPVAVARKHMVPASNRYRSDPDRSTCSHSSDGGIDATPAAKSTARCGCDMADTKGTARSAAAHRAASSLWPRFSFPACEPPYTARRAPAAAPCIQPHKPNLRRHDSGSGGKQDAPAVSTVW
mmetsp:Transcript_21381/g.52825  ORF Transcript_21381/g.52825 Transcript_21381/m.52825 type:complete len:327 (+) Transcript_21381:467-1447(+)